MLLTVTGTPILRIRSVPIPLHLRLFAALIFAVRAGFLRQSIRRRLLLLLRPVDRNVRLREATRPERVMKLIDVAPQPVGHRVILGDNRRLDRLPPNRHAQSTIEPALTREVDGHVVGGTISGTGW